MVYVLCDPAASSSANLKVIQTTTFLLSCLAIAQRAMCASV
jgi:hypothetical protein